MSTVTRKRTNLGGGKSLNQTTTSGPNGTRTSNSTTSRSGNTTTTYNQKTGKTRRTVNNGNGSSTISTFGGASKPTKTRKESASKTPLDNLFKAKKVRASSVESMDLGSLFKVMLWISGIIIASVVSVALIGYISSLFH